MREYIVKKKAGKVVTVGSTVSYEGSPLIAVAITGYITIKGLTFSKVKVKKKTTKKSKKEKSTKFPSWAKYYKPKAGENGSSFAKRICDDRFGKGKYDRGPSSDYNQIKKARDRGAIKN